MSGRQNRGMLARRSEQRDKKCSKNKGDQKRRKRTRKNEVDVAERGPDVNPIKVSLRLEASTVGFPLGVAGLEGAADILSPQAERGETEEKRRNCFCTRRSFRHITEPRRVDIDD